MAPRKIAAAQCGVDYLFEPGQQEISFMSTRIENTSTIEDRPEGFIRSHAEHGVALDRDRWIIGLTNTLDSVNDDIGDAKKHLEQHPEITAIFAEEFNIAIIAQEAARQSGKRVPEYLSIISIDCPVFSLQPFNTTDSVA